MGSGPGGGGLVDFDGEIKGLEVIIPRNDVRFSFFALRGVDALDWKPFPLSESGVVGVNDINDDGDADPDWFLDRGGTGNDSRFETRSDTSSLSVGRVTGRDIFDLPFGGEPGSDRFVIFNGFMRKTGGAWRANLGLDAGRSSDTRLDLEDGSLNGLLSL